MSDDTLTQSYTAGKSYMVDGALINRLIGAIASNKPLSGSGIETEESNAGVTVSLAKTDPGHPAFFLQDVGRVERTFFIRVVEGKLLNYQTGQLLEVDGVGPDQVNDFEVIEGNKIWIEVQMDENVPISASIEWGDAWDGYPKPWAFDEDGNQTAAFAFLARVETVEDIPVILDRRTGYRGLVRAVVGEPGSEKLGWIIL